MPLILSYLLVAAAGVSLAVQQLINSRLRFELASPWWAGAASFSVGTLAMLALALMLSVAPSGAQLARTSWFSWTGGLLGAFFIGTTIVMVPRLGTATTLALVVVGQMLGALVLDHFGVLGAPLHPADPARLAGAAFLVLGVILVRI